MLIDFLTNMIKLILLIETLHQDIFYTLIFHSHSHLFHECFIDCNHYQFIFESSAHEINLYTVKVHYLILDGIGRKKLERYQRI